MGEGTGDKAKGRVKKAIGDLTDDERLRREGKGDEVAGKVKDTVGDVVDRVRGKKH